MERVVTEIGDRANVTLQHVDLGAVGKWGKPVSYDHMENFDCFFNAIWEHSDLPDVVLIDGRFRVACWLTSYLRAAPGTTILFDDYYPRPTYHVVERIDAPRERCGRQAKFVVPESFDRDSCHSMLHAFTNVME